MGVDLSEQFERFHHSEYFNLELFPEAGIAEHEAGLLTELVEMFQGDCTCELLGASEFLADNVPKCQGEHVITYLNGPGECNGVFILTKERPDLNHMYKVRIHGLDKVLYMREYYGILFFKHFENYKFEDGVLYFDNLICLCMIVKNSGPLFEGVLEANKPNFDKWCILDTGSTDGTQDVIRRVLADKKGNLYEEPFVNFKVSRNRCLELAGTSCKFLLTLDDTYIVQGDLRGFLTEIRSDQFSDSFSMLIKSGDSEYYSNRIIKSRTGLRYVYTIHEVIPKENNVNVTVPVDRSFVLDQRSDYMENRTNNRKQFDLELLFKEYTADPSDPRSLYYIAQTYGCMGDEENKAKYLKLRVEHPNEGYIQEKVDACFELARSYNFKLDKEWSLCEEWYKKAYSLDPERPDSLYFLGIHWYIEKNFSLAHEYFKKGFEIGYPLHRQYSLKPTLSFHFLPKFLTETSYYAGDYATGEESARLFLKSNPQGSNSWNMMSSWFSIHSELNKMGPLSETPKEFPSKVFCIVADGGWSDWNGADIYTNGVGGSETWVIEMARNLKINNPELIVTVFCKCKEPANIEGVGYNPIEMFHNFVANHVVDVCLISRYTQYVPVALRGHVKEVGVIFHDLIQDETVVPVHPKLKWMFCLTDWHTRYVKTRFPNFNVQTLNYGVSSKFESGTKVKNSFVYSSFPNRGLVVLLKMWKRIHQKFPDSVLNLYCDVDGEWVNRVAPDEMKEVRCLLTEVQGVANHGWVSKETLAKAWETAEYWLYPCKFEETFCLTALEAAVSKTLAVTNNLAALGDTVGDRGVITHGNPLDESWQDECLEKLFGYMNGTTSKDLLVEKNYSWSKTLTWSGQARKLAEYTGVEYMKPNLDYCRMLNWTVDVPKNSKKQMTSVLQLLPRGSKILEVGTFAGTSLVGFLENVEDSSAVVVDPWENYTETVDGKNTFITTTNFENIEQTFYKNTFCFRDRIKVLKGSSRKKLLELDEEFDFIYIDGSHKCLDVYLDACLSWRLLKIGGYMGFDDYLFNTGDVLGSPKEAVDHFMREHSGEFRVVFSGYRVFLEKIQV
jgi:predicted O-methyltransferase YrrM